jgi:acyl-CoA thioesterase
VAAGGDIVFVAPAREGDLITAEGRMRARYGRNGIYDVAVTCGGQIVAEFRGRSKETRGLPLG